MNQKGQIIIGIIIGFLIAAGLFGAYYLGKSSSKPQPQNPVITSGSITPYPTTSASDATTNWQTYDNPYYTVKYPNDWNLYTLATNDNNFEITSFPLSQAVHAIFIPKGGADFTIANEDNNASHLSLDSYIAKYTTTTPPNFVSDVGNITIDNIQGKVLTDNPSSNPQESPFKGKRAFILKDNRFYTFRIIYYKDDPKENLYLQTFNQIISAFKLVKQNQFNQNSSATTSVTLPIHRLTMSYGIQCQEQIVTTQSEASFVIPNNLKNDVDAYGITSCGGKLLYSFIGPKYWTGVGLIAADGNISAVIVPAAISQPGLLNAYFNNSVTGPNMIVKIDSEGTGSVVRDAALYFPWVHDHYSGLMPNTGAVPIIPAGLKSSGLTLHLLSYSLANTNDGLEVNGVAYSDTQDHVNDNMWSFIAGQVTISSSQHDFATAILNSFIQKEGLDKK